MSKRWLLFTSIVSILLLSVIVIKERYIQKLFLIFNYSENDYHFSENPEYKKQLDLYSVYSKPGNFVMLGNSITQGVNWNELLDRNDILNRGIGFDVTEGFLSRLENIEKINPKACFILGGINDINMDIDIAKIVNNYKLLIKRLNSKKILPIIQTTLHVTEDYPNSKEINKKVKLLNQELKLISKDQSIKLIDLNKGMSKNNALIEFYSYDGIHLNSGGYSKWGTIVKPVIDSLCLTYEIIK